MPPETEPTFQAFFAAKIKERGITIKKLSEATGIAPSHLESMAHGKLEDLPSSPYLHGYIIRLGKALDFDGEAWWEKIKKEGLVNNSGPSDALPRNRFLKQSHTKFIWIGIVVVLVLIYLGFQVPIIFSKPTVTINFPTQDPYTTASSTLTITGTVADANSLALNGDTITIAPDGSWQKTVLLQNGPNTFEITASKLLGGNTNITEQVFYEGGALPVNVSSTASSTLSTNASTSASSTKP